MNETSKSQDTGAETVGSWQCDRGEPTEADLRAIEADQALLDAELALVDAESAWHRNPGRETAAAYLQALLEVFDLYDLPIESSGRAA